MYKEANLNNKRIAKNTILLYLRTLCTMFIGFYTTRITLNALGVVDYGIYNVTGGIVAFFNIISGSMSVSISRFITIWVGKKDSNRLNIVFSTSIIIQVIIAIAICLFIEVIGMWFLNNKIVLPQERLYAAHWVLHCSTIGFMFSLISIPYNAVIIAHERMSAFAYLSIFRALVQLSIVYLVYISPFDKLIFYSIFMAILGIIMRLLYGAYCHKHFEESHFKIVFDRQLLKEMFTFIGWSFLGNAAWTFKGQGTNILLNLFCGPTVNAARAIASQVNGAIYSFVLNFLTAVNPQITKYFSNGDLVNMHTLIIRSSKFAFFILILFLIPVNANIDYILHLWLVEVPKHTANFVSLILLYSLFECFVSPLITGVLAQGSIKSYEIFLTILYSFNLLFSYFVLKAGMEPEWCFILNIIFKIFVVLALLNQSQTKYNFPIILFIKQSAFPCLITFIVCYSFSQILPITESLTFIKFVINSLLILVICLITIWFLGISKKEKGVFMNFAKSKIQEFKKK